MNRGAALAVLVAMFAGCGGSKRAAPVTAETARGDAGPTPLASAPTPSPGGDAGVIETSSDIVQLTATASALPGVSGPAFVDAIFYDWAGGRIWVPVSSTASVDLFDIAKSTFTRIEGFKTVNRETKERNKTLGPSTIALGEGFVYIGNRASSELCPVSLETLKVSKCLKLSTAIEGVAYVATTKEIWVTTGDRTLVVIDATKPEKIKAKTIVKLEGTSRGFAVDEAHGAFLTNLEDKGVTIVVDLKSRGVKSIWNTGCGEGGPRGIAIDAARNFVFVACANHVQVLDSAHDGALLGKLETGDGVEGIDYLEGQKLIYAAAGKAARLTIGRVDDRGRFTVVATGATADGARNAIADSKGNAYVVDSNGGRLLVLAVPGSAPAPAASAAKH